MEKIEIQSLHEKQGARKPILTNYKEETFNPDTYGR
jgi:hypothetical protein